jgi:hypothetical protein
VGDRGENARMSVPDETMWKYLWGDVLQLLLCGGVCLVISALWEQTPNTVATLSLLTSSPGIAGDSQWGSLERSRLLVARDRKSHGVYRGTWG